MQDLDKFKNEMNLSGKNVYVGNRYAPVYLGDWDNTKEYEPLSVVMNQGDSFVSRGYVPKGVDIQNGEYWHSVGVYNAQVADYKQRVESVESGINDVKDDITTNTEKIIKTNETIGIDVWNFIDLINDKENKNSNEWNWYPAIMAAIDEAYNTGLSTVILKHHGNGDYLTDPISMKGYSGIKLIGLGRKIDLNTSYAWGDELKPTKSVRFKFISSGNVGLQFSEYGTGQPSWSAGQCQVENIWLCGNDLTEFTVNGNFGLTLKNVMVTNAIKDGVRLEDLTYPVLIEDSQIGPNGRHGLSVNGAMSTVFTLRRVNSSLNRGYGYLIEGGSGLNFDDCLAQDNTQGGLKISKRNDLHGTKTSNWLNNLVFNNFYSERNGKLDTTNENYEGNYALVIDGIGGSNVTGQIEARNITFNGGALNAIAGGGTYNIKRVYGLTFNEISVDHTKGIVNASECTGLKITTASTSKGTKAPFPFIHTYLEKDRNTTITVSSGGEISSRGRIHSIPFKISGLTADKEFEMKLAYFDEVNTGFFHHGYPIRKGSIVGVKLMTRNGTGTIKATITKGSINGGLVGQTRWVLDALEHDTTKLESEIWFTPLEYTLTNESVGLRVKTSSDYTNLTTDLLAYLIVEE